MQPKCKTHVVPKTGQLSAGMLQRTIGVQNSGTAYPHIGVVVHKTTKISDAVITELNVGIDQKEIIPPGLLDPLVVRSGKAFVFLIDDQAHLGEMLCNFRRCAIRRSVIQNDPFDLPHPRVAEHTLQAFYQICPAVPADYDNGCLDGIAW